MSRIIEVLKLLLLTYEEALKFHLDKCLRFSEGEIHQKSIFRVSKMEKNGIFGTTSQLDLAQCGKVIKNSIALKNFREINSIVNSVLHKNVNFTEKMLIVVLTTFPHWSWITKIVFT